MKVDKIAKDNTCVRNKIFIFLIHSLLANETISFIVKEYSLWYDVSISNFHRCPLCTPGFGPFEIGPSYIEIDAFFEMPMCTGGGPN